VRSEKVRRSGADALAWGGARRRRRSGVAVSGGPCGRRAARSFPFGTLAVNISGAALLGLLGSLALSRHVALVADTAFVGSYTTFSTWMLETQRLSEERQVRNAVANIVVSIVLGIGAALFGQWIAVGL
jgi:CrcB protein